MRPSFAPLPGLALAAALASSLASPASADVAEVIQGQIAPGYARFAAATQALADGAAQDCSVAAMDPAWAEAVDAWMGVQHVRLGPVEDEGRALAIAFWPDPKAIGRRQLRGLIDAKDAEFLTPEGLAAGSVATRGLFGLDTLMHGELADDPAGEGAYACDLRAAMAQDLAAMAKAVEQGWRDGFDRLLLAPGEGGNTLYLDRAEARQALFTQLIAGLEFNAAARLGRPLGTFDHPRPERAELIAAGRSQRNLQLSLEALDAYAHALAEGLGEIPLTEAAFARTHALIADLEDPVFAGVADPMTRLPIEIVQQQIEMTRAVAEAEIGALLGVSSGFNSADGD